jgi:hypothetical protein
MLNHVVEHELRHLRQSITEVGPGSAEGFESEVEAEPKFPMPKQYRWPGICSPFRTLDFR